MHVHTYVTWRFAFVLGATSVGCFDQFECWATFRFGRAKVNVALDLDTRAARVVHQFCSLAFLETLRPQHCRAQDDVTLTLEFRASIIRSLNFGNLTFRASGHIQRGAFLRWS
uniref:U38-Liphistoxin-Lm1a_1 n=1 Tax=Liphistius malayanus TaxID=1203467 RepID=A0A482ZEE8_9ARAC